MLWYYICLQTSAQVNRVYYETKVYDKIDDTGIVLYYYYEMLLSISKHQAYIYNFT